MTLEHAIAILSHTCRDAEEVAAVLLKLATFANVLGQEKSRDDSIESATELIAHCGRFRGSSTCTPAADTMRPPFSRT